MLTNVDSFEVTSDKMFIYLTFKDIMGIGEQYRFLPEDAVRIRDALTEILEDRGT